LESALKVLKFHAMRKSMLEIEYYGEEGTGLGPTLEFFALVKKSLNLINKIKHFRLLPNSNERIYACGFAMI
jgi:hypothetical protein